MKVIIPTPLRSYTGAREVQADGPTLAALLADLDRQFPGIRFRVIDEQDRMRPHVRFFVNGEAVSDLSQPLRSTDADRDRARAQRRLTPVGASRSTQARRGRSACGKGLGASRSWTSRVGAPGRILGRASGNK